MTPALASEASPLGRRVYFATLARSLGRVNARPRRAVLRGNVETLRTVVRFRPGRYALRLGSCTPRTDAVVDVRSAPPRLRSPADDEITIHELDDVPELGGLVPEWEALWAQSERATVFQTPDWLLPWCAHLLRKRPRVVTIRRGARLIGLAPFFLWLDGTRRVLSLMGAGVSYYLDALADRRDRQAVSRALGAWLAAARDWDRCEWSELPEGSLLLDVSVEHMPSTTELHDVCPGLPLEGDRRTLEEVLPRSKWASVAYTRRRASREAHPNFEEGVPATFDSLFGRLEELHAIRWRERGSRGALDDPRTIAFHCAAGKRLLNRGALLLSALRFGNEIVAVLYGFHDRRTTRYYLSGFDPRYGHLSPGALIVAHTIDLALERGDELFDFMRGAEDYKYTWGAKDVRRLYRKITWHTEA